MLLIKCPWCGPRDQTEFSCHGEAHIARPSPPQDLSDADWGDYVFFRTNPKGLHYERWMHSYGCRKWFYIARDTACDRILGSYRVGETPPAAG